jgi:hypothetical protein
LLQLPLLPQVGPEIAQPVRPGSKLGSIQHQRLSKQLPEALVICTHHLMALPRYIHGNILQNITQPCAQQVMQT